MRKNTLLGLFALLVISLFLYFAVAGDLLNTPNVSLPVTETNYSGTVVLNMTNLTTGVVNGTANNHITNVTFHWTQGGFEVFNTTIFNTTTNQSFEFVNTSFDTTLLTDGIYNVTVNVTNHSGGINGTFIENVTIDNSAPTATVTAGLTLTGPGTNLTTGNTTVNVTIDDALLRVDTVYFGFDNDTGNDFNLTPQNNSGNHGLDINATVLIEGRHRFYAFANDTLNNLNNTVLATFYVSRSAPTVNFGPLTATNLTNTSDNTPDIQFNFTDTVFGNASCSLYVDAGATTSNLSAANVTNTSVLNSTNTNFTFDSALAEGLYNLVINCTDGSGNIGNSTVQTISIDNRSPRLGVVDITEGSTTAEISLTTSDNETNVSTCTYEGAGSSGSASANGDRTSFTASLSGLAAETEYNLTVNCTDYAGNKNHSSSVFTTSSAAAAAAASAGGGGSSSGSSQGSAGQFARTTWETIPAGDSVSMDVENGAIGVTQVEFTIGDKAAYGAWVKVERKDSLPNEIPAFGRLVYRINLITENDVNGKLSGDATVHFKVQKSWLNDNDVAKERIGYFHYDGSSWVELDTSMGRDDGEYVQYRAQTPGFSYFIIGEKTLEAAPTPVAEDVAEEIVAEQAEQAAVDEAAKRGVGMRFLWLWIVIALLVIAIGVYLVKKNGSSSPTRVKSRSVRAKKKR